MHNASSASTSPSARAVPSSMTYAAPARANTSNAATNGPSSRTTTVTITVPAKFCAPTRVNNATICPIMTSPSAQARKLVIGSNRNPAR